MKKEDILKRINEILEELKRLETEIWDLKVELLTLYRNLEKIETGKEDEDIKEGE